MNAHPLLDEIATLIDQAGALVQTRVVCEVELAGQRLPVHALALGSEDPAHPSFGVFGGVHGLERIGTEVALAFTASLIRRLRWDATLHEMLRSLRVVVMPLINPGGLMRGTRANPQGVDLMRNAPVECAAGALPLLGGQRVSAGLPWYRGIEGAPMQPEAQALCAVVRTELTNHVFSIAVDCHSGFGLTDRIWFPYAHTTQPIGHLAELHALNSLLDEALIHHRYGFEPQSQQYLAHGDLWDHLYLLSLNAPERVLLPLTLEMGSWMWVKKNPRQVFSRQGLFNPLIVHRQQRVLRRHAVLLDFLLRAAYNHARWRPVGAARHTEHEHGLALWYRSKPTRR